MKTKRIFALSMSLVTALALTACGKSEKQPEVSGNGTVNSKSEASSSNESIAPNDYFSEKYGNLPTYKDVRNNPDLYGGKEFVLSGTAKLDNYYAYDFSGIESLYFCICVTPTGGDPADRWYVYAHRGYDKELYKNLESGSVEVNMVCQSGSSGLSHGMAGLNDCFIVPNNESSNPSDNSNSNDTESGNDTSDSNNSGNGNNSGGNTGNSGSDNNFGNNNPGGNTDNSGSGNNSGNNNPAGNTGNSGGDNNSGNNNPAGNTGNSGSDNNSGNINPSGNTNNGGSGGNSGNNKPGGNNKPVDPCANGHTWEAVNSTVHHDQEGHYESVKVKDEVRWYHCPKCGDEFVSLDDYYSHFDSTHSDVWFLREDYVQGTMAEAEYEEVWVVDREAYDEDVIVGYECSKCGKTKQ